MTNSVFEPSTATGTVLYQVIAGVVTAAALVLLGWLFLPFSWWRQKRQLLRVIHGKRFWFVYNPANNRRKFVTFLEDGKIGEGRHQNEHSWRIKRGKLDVMGEDGKLYSRFAFNADTGRLERTNDPDCRSILGQYFEPCWERVRGDASASDEGEPVAATVVEAASPAAAPEEPKSTSQRQPVVALTVEQIYRDIDSRPPFQQDAAAGHYVGMRIRFEGVLTSALPTANDRNARVRLANNVEAYYVSVSFVVALEQYPEIKVTPPETPLVVEGRIVRVHRDRNVELEDILLSPGTASRPETPRLSTSSDCPSS